jgi:aminopeptidase N
LLLNDDDLSYAQVRFDERSIGTLVNGIGDIADALARTVCWTAAWDMVRAGELAARDYIRMVLAGADSETEIGVLESMHRNVIGAVEQFVSAGEADATAALLAEAAADRLRTVEAGSDEQLAWARLLAKVARTRATLQLVTGLVGGSIVVDGLVMDSDLRWALLATLARNGRADKADIDAELALDPTTVGQQYAAGAEAAIPTAEAKARAWASVMDRDDLPNAVQRQVVGGRYSRMGLGFQQANQAELLGDYAPRYFAVVGQIWASRPLEIARTLVSGLYPRTVVDQATVDATDAYLADPEVPPALRRLLVEARDDVERALKARSVDAAPHSLSAWRT